MVGKVSMYERLQFDHAAKEEAGDWHKNFHQLQNRYGSPIQKTVKGKNITNIFQAR